MRFDYVPNKPDYAYTNQDIAGSSPSIVAFKTTRIGTNPLNPSYKIQSYTEVEHEIPRFVRDSIDCSVNNLLR